MTNTIHATAIVEEGVTLGKNNYIGPFCYIKSGTIIGNNNRFEAYCSIGTPAEHKQFFTENGYPVIIGNDNIFREFVTINAGTKNNTVIKNGVTMLKCSHIGHDSVVYSNSTLSCSVLIGGHSILMEGCNFGLSSMCHQYSVIGAYSFIGMGAVVTKGLEVSPGDIFVGAPAKFLKRNQIGLDRGGITNDMLASYYNEWMQLTIK